jgi:hypothetical protein
MKILKGNFDPKNDVAVEEPSKNLTDRFEKEALKRLGGSIAYVKKAGFLYTGEDQAPDSDD